MSTPTKAAMRAAILLTKGAGSFKTSTFNAIVESTAKIIDEETGLPEFLELAKRVAEHFADTDAPLGILARSLIVKAVT